MRVFKSRVDGWVWPALALPLLVLASLTAGALWSDAPGASAGSFAGLILYVLVLFGLVLPMRYTLRESELEIRFGLVRMRIPWDHLVSARLSSNPLSSPALSLLRIEIEYRGAQGGLRTVRVSPVDRLAFLRALAEVSPRHRLANDTVLLR